MVRRLQCSTGVAKRVQLDLSGVKRVFRIVVTLEDLSSVTTVLWQLQDAGMFADREALPWVVGLNELEIIAELVEYPAQFVHFLLRRLRLNELKRVVASDELDWFMNYLRDGLYFENEFAEEDAPDRIFLDSYTDEVDAYIFAREGRTRDKPTKPRQRQSRKVGELLAYMLRAHAPTDALLAFLDINGPAREMLASRIQTLRRRSGRDGYFHDMTMTFDNAGYLGITAMTAPPDKSGALRERLELYCAAKKYQCHAERWLGLGAYEGPRDPVQFVVVDVEPWREDATLENVVTSLGLTIGRPAADEAAG